ncbi:uncharacterized protein LOC129780301 [Toxorhynchites rutilus septentrionalis]|uniref:uncharacterized protein LOC129780301 n=1 Tax=Toxorhynchites rutilus septentrionalis TaxID=329112 RepID=UPI0024797B08|nr:uncharacterized protein LOC129780301 [Toxorhynchites rutilus septentrionalis]
MPKECIRFANFTKAVDAIYTHKYMLIQVPEGSYYKYDQLPQQHVVVELEARGSSSILGTIGETIARDTRNCQPAEPEASGGIRCSSTSIGTIRSDKNNPSQKVWTTQEPVGTSSSSSIPAPDELIEKQV